MDNQAFKLLMDKLNEHGDGIDEIKAGLSEVKSDLSHYKGFVGGVLFVFTAVWTGVTFFWDKLTGGGHST